MKTIPFALVALFLTACATAYSSVVPMGGDAYFVSRQSGNAFGGAATLKSEVLQEANTHCITQRRVMEVITLTEARPPYILGNYPKAEVQFRCK
jgi:hypothetical protein